MRKANNQQSSSRRNAEDNEPILTERMVGIGFAQKVTTLAT